LGVLALLELQIGTLTSLFKSRGRFEVEMRRGLVYSVAELGIDEDEGRTRLTFH